MPLRSAIGIQSVGPPFLTYRCIGSFYFFKPDGAKDCILSSIGHKFFECIEYFVSQRFILNDKVLGSIRKQHFPILRKFQHPGINNFTLCNVFPRTQKDSCELLQLSLPYFIALSFHLNIIKHLFICNQPGRNFELLLIRQVDFDLMGLITDKREDNFIPANGDVV